MGFVNYGAQFSDIYKFTRFARTANKSATREYKDYILPSVFKCQGVKVYITHGVAAHIRVMVPSFFFLQFYLVPPTSEFVYGAGRLHPSVLLSSHLLRRLPTDLFLPKLPHKNLL